VDLSKSHQSQETIRSLIRQAREIYTSFGADQAFIEKQCMIIHSYRYIPPFLMEKCKKDILLINKDNYKEFNHLYIFEELDAYLYIHETFSHQGISRILYFYQKLGSYVQAARQYIAEIIYKGDRLGIQDC